MANHSTEPHIQTLAIEMAGFGEVSLYYTPLNSQARSSTTHLRFSSFPVGSESAPQRADRPESEAGPASTQPPPAPDSHQAMTTPPSVPSSPRPCPPTDERVVEASEPLAHPDTAHPPSLHGTPLRAQTHASNLAPTLSVTSASSLPETQPDWHPHQRTAHDNPPRARTPASNPAPALSVTEPSSPVPSQAARRSASCVPETQPDWHAHPRTPHDTPPRARTPTSNPAPASALSVTEPSSPAPSSPAPSLAARRSASCTPETQPDWQAHPRTPHDAPPRAHTPTSNPAPALSVTEPSSPASSTASRRSESCVPETQQDSYNANETFSFELDKLAGLKRPLELTQGFYDLVEEIDAQEALEPTARLEVPAYLPRRSQKSAPRRTWRPRHDGRAQPTAEWSRVFYTAEIPA
ncbi:hypothetical protein FA95DRAFT_1611275 [Auriscalpium vulgare]|uniref:Uncharacterized protein n=1 Tax=Auriscalpium vulgare TaxID=40419 RepID=A0ACB8RAD1_9AGAM|nr:hypothetical protein FA95DRAFT_1611275 [Auriscalpium vulgare]